MSDELQELDGVGPARAEELVDADYETVAAVAAADPESVADATSMSTGTAERLVSAAEDAAGISLVESDITETVTESTDTEDSVDNSNESDDTVTVELTDDETITLHILHVVLEEATSQMQSSNSLMRDNTYSVAQQMCEQLAADADTYTVTGTRDEMNALYRAVSSGEHDYASRSGIPSMYGDFRSIKEDINDARDRC